MTELADKTIRGRVYSITHWHLYEPPDRSTGTAGPLDWHKSRVHGFNLSPAYRRLQAVCGDDLQATMGLFGKLLELAADQPREFRDGTIRICREGKPANLVDIAFNTGFSLAGIVRSMQHLINPLSGVDGEVGWVSVEQWPAIAGDCGDSPRSPETAGNPRDLRARQDKTRQDKTRLEQQQTNTNDAAVVLEMERLGIANPTRDRLIQEVPGLSVAIVGTLANQVKHASNPAGLLVQKIRQEGPKLTLAASKRSERAVARKLEQHAAVDGHAALRAFIAELPDSELEDAKRDVLRLETTPQFARDRWARASPRENRGLMIAIRDLLSRRNAGGDRG